MGLRAIRVGLGANGRGMKSASEKGKPAGTFARSLAMGAGGEFRSMYPEPGQRGDSVRSLAPRHSTLSCPGRWLMRRFYGQRTAVLDNVIWLSCSGSHSAVHGFHAGYASTALLEVNWIISMLSR